MDTNHDLLVDDLVIGINDGLVAIDQGHNVFQIEFSLHNNALPFG